MVRGVAIGLAALSSWLLGMF
ncbi:hypothetical protein PPSIR1_19809 [Plesiocystis pacifica SIR-1]|uniref:Uncharacterized protein n=1 Tax=Plesiocystis pacifica SIR-1 TaxID=391625 RepID=A6GDR4_9BACT|nr:hypothetical protein PPSIR1_19809 [Plesiocystis pacifica SIR-1]